MSEGEDDSAAATPNTTRRKINHLLESEKFNTKCITTGLKFVTAGERLSADPKICFINSN